MLTALLGVGTALFFGAADFLGGLAAQRVSALRASGLSAASGLLVFAALTALGLAGVPGLRGEWSAAVLGWGTLGGVVAASTVALLYASLAIGPMSILAPLTAVVAAFVPVAYGFARGEQLAPLGYAGIAAALAAAVLVGVVPHRDSVRPGARGLVLAALAGASMGSGILVLDNAPDDSALLPLVVGRVVSVSVIVLAAVVVARMARRGGTPSPRGRATNFALGAGVLAAAADVLMLTGVRVGAVSVVGVLAALCSAVTIVLAAIVLRERMSPPQVAGLVLAVAAAVLLAAG